MSSISSSTPFGYNEPIDAKDLDPQLIDHVATSEDTDAQRTMTRQAAPVGGRLLARLEKAIGATTKDTKALDAPNFTISGNDGGRALKLSFASSKNQAGAISTGFNLTETGQSPLSSGDVPFPDSKNPSGSTTGSALLLVESHERLADRARQLITNVMTHGSGGQVSNAQLQNAMKIVDGMDQQVAQQKAIIAKCPEANFALGTYKAIGGPHTPHDEKWLEATQDKLILCMETLATRPGLSDDERKCVHEALERDLGEVGYRMFLNRPENKEQRVAEEGTP